MSRLSENKKYLLKTVKITELLYKSGKYNDCLLYIEKISHFAWFNFAGYYTLNCIESIIRKIAFKNLQFKEQAISDTKEDSTLHIFSEIYPVGGHSKLMFNWIEYDNSSKHYLLSTRQSPHKISEIAKSYDFVIDNNLFTYDQQLSLIDKAQKIINTLTENYFDRIILHIHPNDVIPSLVFSSDKIKSPVFFMNHAEHTFWLGAPIIDVLLQIKATNIQKDFRNRNIPIEDQFFLPIPVDESYSLKNQLNTTFNILSIGTEVKYEPNEEFNFFEAALNIVKKFDHIVFFIIGISANNHHKKKYQHERLVFVEPTREIHKYIETADLYLEGFPIPSFTSLLEPAMAGVPFVLHYNPTGVYKVFETDKKNGIFYPTNLDEWYTLVEKMISDEKYRKHINELQLSYLKNNYSLDAWRTKLKIIKNHIEGKKHTLRNIPESEVYREGKDEKLVSVIGTQTVSHYHFTGNLEIVSKLKVVMWSFNNPSGVKIFSPKQILRYLLFK